MSTSLPSLVDNLSEIYSKGCKRCKERKKIKSVCNFIGLKNNKLSYKCKGCEKRQLKPMNGLINKFSNTYKFCNNDINKFILLIKKVFILMNTWTVGKDLMKHHYLIKKLFTDYKHAQKVFE